MGRGRAVQGFENGQHRGMWGYVGSGLMRTLAVVTISISAVPVIAIILVVFLTVVTFTISAILVSPWRMTTRMELPTDDQESENGHECHGGRGRSRDHGRDGRPCGESSRERGEGWETDDEENEEGGDHGHDQSQSAKTQTEECEPTAVGMNDQSR